MDFRHLRAFIAVAEESSVTKAAERLHISQPPLSRQIRQLEEELGVPLFVRHPHGVTLTEEGRHLLEKGRMLAQAASDFFETARQAKRDDLQRVRVGIGWGLWEVVNRIRVEYARRSPDVTIEASDAYCGDRYNEDLHDRSLDVLFARPPFDPALVCAETLFHERIVAVVSETSPLASRKSLRIRDLANETLLLWDRHVMPVLYDKVLELYAGAGVTPSMNPTPGAGPYNNAGLMLVASGKGTYLCIGIPLSSPRPASGVAVVPVSDADATIPICVAWRKGETSAAILQLLDCVRAVFPQEQPAPTTIAPSRRAS